MGTEDGKSGERSGGIGSNSRVFYVFVSIALRLIKDLGKDEALDSFLDEVKKELDEEKDPGYISRFKQGIASVESTIRAMRNKPRAASSTPVTATPTTAATAAPATADTVQQAAVARDEKEARKSNYNMMLDFLKMQEESGPADVTKIPYPAANFVVTTNSEGDRVVRLCSRDLLINKRKAQILCHYDCETTRKDHPLICRGPDNKPCFKQVQVAVMGNTDSCFSKVFKYEEGALVRYWCAYVNAGNDGNIDQWYGQLFDGELVPISKEEYGVLEAKRNAEKAAEKDAKKLAAKLKK